MIKRFVRQALHRNGFGYVVVSRRPGGPRVRLPYPGHQTSCDEFGGDAHVEPRDLIGNWTTVYSWSDPKVNMTEIITISELTEEQKRQYDYILKDYPESTLKLKMLIHDLPKRVITFLDIISVMVPKNNLGDLDAWAVDIETNREHTVLPNFLWVKYATRLKKMDDFLVLMICSQKKAFVLASSSTPDEDKLQKIVADIHFEGYDGSRVYSTT